MDLLRFTAAGNVDDGKSTLIGRLFYDSRAIPDDQLRALEAKGLNLALLTDGLRAEREQGITIDVAYRYFTTKRRKFIVADTPGHFQYTRNMVTGASTADLALILVDVTRGIAEQTRRHAYLASLLRIPHLVYCVNKMDLVNYSQDAFESLVERLREHYNDRLREHHNDRLREHHNDSLRGPQSAAFIPVSALKGDNIARQSELMPWYRGPTLLSHLEEVRVESEADGADCRFPVQWVIQAPRYRGYAGMLASGRLCVGDEVVSLSGYKTRVRGISCGAREMAEAVPGQSVVLRLEDELELGRGEMLLHVSDQAKAVQEFEAMVCWLGREPLSAGNSYHLRHTTNDTKCRVEQIKYRIEMSTLEQVGAPERLTVNDIGLVRFRAAKPLLLDLYAGNRVTGSFVLVDERTNETVGAAMASSLIR